MTAAMAEITVPDPDELLLSWPKLRTPTQVNRSSWTGRRKVIGLPGTELWTGAFAIGDIATEEEEQPWRAFLFGLGGPANWFRWPLPCNEHAGAKPTVDTGAGNAYSLPLTGMQVSTLIAKAGQYMTIPLPSGHKRAVCLMADLLTDSSGDATAQFRPALNEVPVAGVTVETKYPYIPMSPVEDELGLSGAEGVSGAEFEVEEAFGAALVGDTPDYTIPTFDDDSGDFTFDMDN
jgi:hypothetical protein